MNGNEIINLQDVEKSLDDIIKGSQERVIKARLELQEVREQMEAELKKLEQATFEGIESDYKSAQDELGRLEQRKGFLEKRIRLLLSEQLLRAEDYDKYVQDVNSRFDEYEAKVKEELCRLSDQIGEVRKNFIASQEIANRVLHKAQVDCYRLGDCARTNEGYPITAGHIKKVDGNKTLNWSECALRNSNYREYKGLPRTFTKNL